MELSPADQIPVYVVDDDPQTREAVHALLRSYGITCRTYPSAPKFLERLPPPRPGCVVLDLSMPGMGGLELQQALADRGQCLAVVFITGSGSYPASVKAIKAGAVDFLTKPFEEEALIAAIQEASNRSRQLFAASQALEKDWAVFKSLSAREQQVCLLVADGRLNKQIAFDLGPTEKTIKLHRANVMRKLQVDSLADLVKLVQRLKDAGRIGSSHPQASASQPA